VAKLLHHILHLLQPLPLPPLPYYALCATWTHC